MYPAHFLIAFDEIEKVLIGSIPQSRTLSTYFGPTWNLIYNAISGEEYHLSRYKIVISLLSRTCDSIHTKAVFSNQFTMGHITIAMHGISICFNYYSPK